MKNTVIEKLQNLPEQIEAAERLYDNASIELQEAKDELDEKEAALILSGKIDGKNAELRQAQMLALIRSERKAVRSLEKEVSRHKVDLNSLVNEFKAYRSIARLLSQGGGINDRSVAGCHQSVPEG